MLNNPALIRAPADYNHFWNREPCHFSNSDFCTSPPPATNRAKHKHGLRMILGKIRRQIDSDRTGGLLDEVCPPFQPENRP